MPKDFAGSRLVREAEDGCLVDLPIGATIVDRDGVQHPWAITELWSDAQLRRIGVYRVRPARIPKGKVSRGCRLERKGRRVVEVHALDRAPRVRLVEKELVLARVRAAGSAADGTPYELLVARALDADPVAWQCWRRGGPYDAADPRLCGVIEAAGLDPAKILAPERRRKAAAADAADDLVEGAR